jgi:hypothetical protein
MNKMIPIEDIDQDKAPTIYRTGGLGVYIEYIRGQVANEIPDLTTVKGRSRIASLAAQVSKSKVAIEKPGREYLKHIKDLPKQVEAELREFVQSCDALRDEIRKPLTDWENAEQARLDAHKSALARIQAMAYHGNDSLTIERVMADLNAMEFPKTKCEEFHLEYLEAQTEALCILRERHKNAQELEKQQAEIERLQKEAEERERKERDERIAREAAERERQESIRREERLKVEAERLKREKEEAIERAEREKAFAEARAKQEADAAIERERKRIEEEQARAREEEERRQQNKAHRNSVNRDVFVLLVKSGIDKESAKIIVDLASKNQLGALKIIY